MKTIHFHLFYQAVADLLLATKNDENTSPEEEITIEEPIPVENVLEPCSASPWMFDIGIQCCFGPKTLKNAATQTDNDEATSCPPNVTVITNSDVPLPIHANAEEWKIKNDHSYAMQVPSHVTFPTYEDDSFNATSPPPLHVVEVTCTENVGSDDESDGDEDDDACDEDDQELDPNWQLPYDEKVKTGDDTMLSEEEIEEDSSTPDCEKKFIVFDSCLTKLLKRCPDCGDVIAQQKSKTIGSMLSIELTCHSGHLTHWESQPVIKRKPVGNLLLAASILFTGNTFAAINRLASCFNLQFISERVFYDTQQKYLFPVINEAWAAESTRQVEMLNGKRAVNLDGDGRCDSPGHSAKFGTYTLMDDDTGNVVAFNVVQVSEVTSSNAMEKEGFSR